MFKLGKCRLDNITKELLLSVILMQSCCSCQSTLTGPNSTVKHDLKSFYLCNIIGYSQHLKDKSCDFLKNEKMQQIHRNTEVQVKV